MSDLLTQLKALKLHGMADCYVELRQQGNGIQTQQAYTPQTGLLFALGSTSTGASNDIQNLGFTFDAIGNLTARDNLALGVNETFAYDVLNRMTATTLTNGGTPLTTNYTYDALGNITYKSDIGTYSYGNGAGAHAVTTAGGHALGYDANGNQTSGWNFKAGKARTLSYTSYNKPQDIRQLESDGVTLAAHLTYAYGTDRNLFKQKNELSGKTTLYLGDLYEHETEGTLITHTHYIQAGGVTVAQYRSRSNATEDTRYLHRDHLGSIAVITDATAQIVEQLSYDAHGQRRNINGTPSVGPLTALETLRGFTGHRHLDDVGLIHMGGRVYDPDLGRFLSPDPFIQEPANAQNLNRYSYVLNNPLSYTDPSGFFFSSIFKAIGKAFKAVVGFLKNSWRTILAIAAAAIIGPYCAPCAGFAAGMISSGGDLKAGIIGMITAGAFDFVGHSQMFGEFLKGFGEAAWAVKTVAHGIVGGLSQEIGSGDFLSGFLSAGFVQGFGQLGGFKALGIKEPGPGVTLGAGDYVQNAVAAAVIGGTASVLGGGKFQNGALTGAFSRLFNDVSVQMSFGKRIAEAAMKLYKDGAAYGTDDVVGIYPSGSYKCGKYVYDSISGAGIDAPTLPGGPWAYRPEQWGNPDLKIQGWLKVDISEAQAGDVIAQIRAYSDASGHVGIVVGSGQTISAHNFGLGIDNFGFVDNPQWSNPIVVRRYIGK